MRYSLPIPLPAISKNDVKPDMGVFRMGARLIPAAYIRVKRLEEKWDRAIPTAAGSQRAVGRRRLQVVRVMGPRQRPFDEWNLVAGMNAVVVDLLVRKGWLLDDRPDAVDMARPLQVRAGPTDDVPQTLIVLEDLPA